MLVLDLKFGLNDHRCNALASRALPEDVQILRELASEFPSDGINWDFAEAEGKAATRDWEPLKPASLIRQLGNRILSHKNGFAKEPRIPPMSTPTDTKFPILDVIEACKVSEYKDVYAIGCWEKRVNFLSQQSRALNLVYALHHGSRINAGNRVAVIGAGIAGTTAAIALSLLEANVTVFEEKEPLHLQRDAEGRYIHPRWFDWPEPGWENEDAGLPIMNWTAGPIEVIYKNLLAEWTHWRRCRKITVAGGVAEVGEGPTVTIKDGHQASSFDVVILAVGFGLERPPPRLPKQCTSSYWSNDGLGFSGNSGDRILVSGGGDGALIDLARAALSAGHGAFNHQELMKDLMANAAAQEFARTIENLSYDEVQKHYVPEELKKIFQDKATVSKRIFWNLPKSKPKEPPYGKEAALVNRVVIHAMLAAGLIETIFRGEIKPKSSKTKIQVDGQEFDRLIARWGSIQPGILNGLSKKIYGGTYDCAILHPKAMDFFDDLRCQLTPGAIRRAPSTLLMKDESDSLGVPVRVSVTSKPPVQETDVSKWRSSIINALELVGLRSSNNAARHLDVRLGLNDAGAHRVSYQIDDGHQVQVAQMSSQVAAVRIADAVIESTVRQNLSQSRPVVVRLANLPNDVPASASTTFRLQAQRLVGDVVPKSWEECFAEPLSRIARILAHVSTQTELHLVLQCTHATSLRAGAILKQVTGQSVIVHWNGSQWPMQGPSASTADLKIDVEDTASNPRHLVVLLSFNQDIRPDWEPWAKMPNRAPLRILHVQPVRGPSEVALRLPLQAVGWAQVIGERIRQHRPSSDATVSLFVDAPPPVCVAVGRELDAVGCIFLKDWNNDTDQYKDAFVFHS